MRSLVSGVYLHYQIYLLRKLYVPANQTVHVHSAMLVDWFSCYETRQMSYEKISQGFAVSDQAWQYIRGGIKKF